MNKFYLLFLITYTLFISHIALGEGNNPINFEGGLRFSSYEQTKDLRTGLNLTPEGSIDIDNLIELEFDMSFWRLTDAYGHIFRIKGDNGIKIDLISSPLSSSLDDLTLIVGDSATALSFSFSEIRLDIDRWKKCKLSINRKEQTISLSFNDLVKSQEFALDLSNVHIAFGKNNFGLYSISDVPPINLRNIRITNDQELIRDWPLIRHWENYSYDKLDQHKSEATNPNWIINNHSKWKLERSILTSTRPQIVFDYKNQINLLTNTHLIRYDLSLNELAKDSSLNVTTIPDQQSSIFMPELNEIWTYSLHEKFINKYDVANKAWEETRNLPTFSLKFDQSNKTLAQDGSAIFFGGYGHYTYENKLHRIQNDSFKSSVIKTIEPRYLAAMGKNNKGSIYIFGGYGSKSGNQEISPRPFYQLHSLDIENNSSKKLWELKDNKTDDVFSNSLVFDSSDSVFYVLRYPKDKYSCKVILESYNIYTMERISFADSLDFNFSDISAYADLYLDSVNNQLVSVLMSATDDGYITNIHSINFPPVTLESIYQTPPTNYGRNPYIWSIILLILSGIAVVIYKTRFSKSEELEVDASSAPLIEIESDFDNTKSTISLMGGFQVIDKNSKDITEKFTGTLRMLLSLILLHSTNGKGVSSTFIWETIWDDKPEDKARNNRNVNIKKLRGLLEEVGTIEIKNTGDKWGIVLGEDVFFDYGYVQNIITNNAKLPSTALKLVRKGNILPAMEDDWVDSFKAKFSNQLVDNLLRLSKEYKSDDQIQIDIADTIFSHDIINQDALSIKIHCLNANHKFALAKKSYESYVKEYKILYDEDFEVPFESMIHNS
ncbi:MAG: hypothetical protein JXR07_10615 [Reichenbachiella sp.]